MHLPISNYIKEKKDWLGTEFLEKGLSVIGSIQK